MSENQNIAYFLSFCIEEYKKHLHTSGSEAMQRMKNAGVMSYLTNHYEVLHTQSVQWLMEDIDEFIRLHQNTHTSL